MEQSLLYFPERDWTATPAEIGLKYTDEFFQTDSGRKLHGWHIPHPASKAAFLFFHGNAGNISHRLEKLKIFHDLQVATFIIDYSGYGKSEGTPSEQNLYEDGEASYRHALGRLSIDPKKLFLYGESLGSAVAIELARGKKVAGIILEGAFTSLQDLAKRHMPFLPPRIKDAFNNLEKIMQVKAPLLFIHPKRDAICPFEWARQLYEKAPLPKEKVWLEEGGHNDAFYFNRQSFTEGIEKFIQLAAKRR